MCLSSSLNVEPMMSKEILLQILRLYCTVDIIRNAVSVLEFTVCHGQTLASLMSNWRIPEKVSICRCSSESRSTGESPVSKSANQRFFR